ncbi:glutamine synthetase family protein [Pseudoalteromonas denitrificans]|uniref:L-glutamine synthetase n=1 Tax=Pseudoalteromonas denitrificans DSM 6059 TaxID=1123010 RepID=A0A1I1LE47_9GAMM|nr:glutamine synthetase [Pseudoalteromonas denitrificans]SFC71437.1 L-glutamine synthetase [Pseudoalteromonas denitrificans DSM 6059]
MLEPRKVQTIIDAKKIVEQRGLSHVKVGLFDIDGVMRGKYMSKEKFFSSLDNGFAFCDVVLGWDVNDQLYDNASYTGWHTGYPDAQVEIIPNSCREIPLEENMLLFIVQFTGCAAEICPRNILNRIISQAADMGFTANAAFEYEFFMFNETPNSVRAKNYQNLIPMTPGNFGYSMLRNSTHADVYQQILQLSQVMDFEIEGLHAETGPGVLEAAINHDIAQNAADKAALFKTFIKVWAQKNDLMATFMAKWSNKLPGQSGHIHISLKNIKGDPVFYDETKKFNMSDIQRHFLAGQQKYMPEFLSMIAPTINSYSRMVPGLWAPLDATWGVENRTTALRLIPGTEKSQRIEYRLGAADANPYIALAAALGSGLLGIKEKLEPGVQVQGNAYEQTHSEAFVLPKSLLEAANKLKQSHAAKKLFGEAFVTHFSASRIWEEQEYRKHISDWELQRYFEII